VGDLSPEAEGSSGYRFDADVTELEFAGLSFVGDGDEFEFHIVRIGKDKIVAHVKAAIMANASAYFRFYVYDEGDEIPMGDCHAETEIEFDAGVLLTFEGDFASEPPSAIKVTEVELVDAIKTVDFGNVEIEWDPGDRYDD
jgi:hypothetical protein